MATGALSLLLAGQLFLGDFDIGPVSLRVYVLVTLCLGAVVRAVSLRQPLVRYTPALTPCLAYSALIVWIASCRLAAGDPMSVVARALASTHVFAALTFIIVQYFVRTTEDAERLAIVMLSAVALSAGIAIAQWFGVSLAWEMALALRPGEAAEALILGRLRGESGYVPGLAPFSIALGYQLVSVAGLALALLSRTPSFKGFGLLVQLVTALLAAGLLVSQSRSALVAFLVMAVCSVVLVSGRRWVTVTAGAFIICSGAALLLLITGEDTGAYGLQRVLSMDDPLRAELNRVALSLIPKYFIMGGGIAEFNDILALNGMPFAGNASYAPHNMFLMAGLYYGAIGICLTTIVTGLLLKSVVCTLRTPVLCTNWIAVGTALGLIGIFINSQFHNESIVSGSALPWWLAGLHVSVLRIARSDT
jgi:hypothetical protein